jgi:3-dehydroquinate synthase
MRIYLSNLCNSQVRIAVGRGSLEGLREINEDAFLLYSKRIDPGVVTDKIPRISGLMSIDDGEPAKDIEYVINILKRIHRETSPDLEWIIAMGGGTIMDIGGFIASIYRRGVKLANIPTTLLGMVDASMGGKNGVNLDGVKNVIGTFYQPRLVISDTIFLRTLPREEISNGSAEIIKYCMTLDRDLCYILEKSFEKIFSLDDDALEEIIYRSAVNKMKVVETDERDDRGIRIVLNYGHTIGHAIEAGSGFRINHGRAISLGMICEAKLAEELGFIGSNVISYLERLLRLYNLPTSREELGARVDLAKAVEALRRDKKRRRGLIKIPVLKEIGAWEKMDLEMEVLEGCLKKCVG